MTCRICESPTKEVLDLGTTPPANGLLDSPDTEEKRFPLQLEWCESCSNVQLRDCLSADDLYKHYLYVTPRSSTLDRHYEYLSNFLFSSGYLSESSVVFEIGSNAGYFLKHLQPSVSKVIGIDPAHEIAAMAEADGIPTIVDFFNKESAEQTAEKYGQPDLVIGRHCMAHNEWPQAMVAGAAAVLPEGGHLVIENAYLMNTLENGEFDQVYHEHMFYYSISSLGEMLRREGFELVDATMSLVHGGSLVAVARRGGGDPSDAVNRYKAREDMFLNAGTFERFADRATEIKQRLGELVGSLASSGNSVYTYGATAKGNTLLNYVGLNSEQMPYCVDNTEMKQGKFLPGSHIEVMSETDALKDPPDYFLLTAWNYQDEIIAKVRAAGNSTSQFIVPIPFVRIV